MLRFSITVCIDVGGLLGINQHAVEVRHASGDAATQTLLPLLFFPPALALNLAIAFILGTMALKFILNMGRRDCDGARRISGGNASAGEELASDCGSALSWPRDFIVVRLQPQVPIVQTVQAG